jgi:PEP-CTERM motif
MKRFFCALAALSLATAAQAAPILGLFNTGTNASNLALAGGDGVVDPHYVIQSSTSPGFAGSQAVTYFNGAYAPNDANSRWISLSANGSPGSNTTVYRTTFSLAGLDPTTAAITGLWGADNIGTIFLNGVSTGVTTSTFSSLTAFSITSGFVAGLNTLDFQVVDQGAPTALRVDDLVGTAREVSGAVPEPASWAMMLLGFGAAGMAIRRQRVRFVLG